MRILLTNDDGIYAEGIYAAYKELVKFADVTVVAPELRAKFGGAWNHAFLSAVCQKSFSAGIILMVMPSAASRRTVLNGP